MEELIKAIEEHGWQVHITEQDGQKIAELERFAPGGEDFVTSVWFGGGTTEEFANALDEYCENYDVDYETYIWLGDDGHGKNGAPYHIKDILADKEWELGKLKELSTRIKTKFNIKQK